MTGRNKGYAVVVGCANVDIGGKPFAPLVERDSNPGAVRISYGGVGRNIAHDLALLGVKVYMLTALGRDGFSDGLLDNCLRAGIDMSHAARYADEQTSAYVFVADPDGDMRVAVCDARISERIDEGYLKENLPLLNGASAVVIDGNLSPTAIDFVTRSCTAPIFADPVSVGKAMKLKPVLPRIFSIKPNVYEAERLSGLRITDRPSLSAAAARLLEAGTERVYISMGAQGLFCAGEGRELLVPPCAARMVNATGGGDAAMAMLVRAHMDGLPMERAARLAAAAGSIAVESEAAVNTDMCMERILARAQEKEN